MKCDIINDVKLFQTVYRKIYCNSCKLLTLFNQVAKASALELAIFIEVFISYVPMDVDTIYVPLHEKTCLRGLQTTKVQTSLHIYAV